MEQINEKIKFNSGIYGIKPEIMIAAENRINQTRRPGYHTYRECFYEFFKELQQEYIRKGKSPRTLADVESCNRLYVLADDLPYETFADDYVELITPGRIKKMKKNIEQFNHKVNTNKRKRNAKGLSHKRLNNIYCWIDSVFKYAYDQGYINYDIIENSKLTKFGGVPQRTHAAIRNFFTEGEFLKFDRTYNEQAYRFFSRDSNAKYKVDDLVYCTECLEHKVIFKCLLFQAFFHVAFYTGLRKNEIRGLRWKDILDQDKTKLYSIRVDKQYDDKCTQYVNKGDHTRNPKSEDSIRVCYMHVKCYQKLKLLKLYLISLNLYGADNYIFFDYYVKTPKPIPETNLDRCFKRMLSLSGIIESSIEYMQCERSITIHGLRHAACTMLLEKGMDICNVAKFLGHKDTKMVEEVYREFVLPTEMKEEQLEKLCSFFH